MSGYATGSKLARQTVKSTRIHLGTATAHNYAKRMQDYCPDASQHHNANGLIIQPETTIMPQMEERGANHHCRERQLLEIWSVLHCFLNQLRL